MKVKGRANHYDIEGLYVKYVPSGTVMPVEYLVTIHNIGRTAETSIMSRHGRIILRRNWVGNYVIVPYHAAYHFEWTPEEYKEFLNDGGPEEIPICQFKS